MSSQRVILTSLTAFILLCLTAQAAWAVDFHFSWLPNSEANVAGYRMYYGLSSRNYTGYVETGTVPDSVTGRIMGTIPNLDAQVVYYFAVTAFTVDNVESDFSTEISASIQPAELNLLSPADGSFSAPGATIQFTASAIDTDGSDISAATEWSSDLDGILGTGSSLAVSTLSPGTHNITASVTDSSGQIQEKSILITIDNPAILTSFSMTDITSYSAGQDGTGTVTVEDNGATVTMTGNRWVKTGQLYTITADTILEFDFLSTTEGEIHGIGFDEDDDITNNKRVFQIFGSQIWSDAIQVSPKYSSTEAGTWVHFSIAVGQFYSGSNMRMVLVNDHDNDPANGTGSFRNIRVRRSFLDLNQTDIISYGTGQDGSGTVTVEDSGATLAIAGNRWVQTQQLYTITPETVIEFDFLSSAEGEIHGIGFDEDGDLFNSPRVFQLFGSQTWNNAIQVTPKYTTTDIGNWVHFTIAAGEFYTGTGMRMVFVNDDDRDPAAGTGRFKNIMVHQVITKTLGDTLTSDYTGTIAETFTNLDPSINEGVDHISTWSWSSPAPHTPANTIILKSDLSDIPANAVITEARVYLYQTGSVGAAQYSNSIHKIIGTNPIIAQVSGYNARENTPWTAVQDGTSYTNVPMGLGDIAPAEDTVLLDSTTGYRSWKITNMVQDWINHPETNYGLLIKGESTDMETGRTFAASENQDASIRPFIVLRYSVGM